MTTSTVKLSDTPMGPSDDQLMARLNTGDTESSLALLQRRYRERIHNLVNGIVRDADMADDVTQEAFTKVFLKSHIYTQGTSFRAWLWGIARNQALSALRARRRTPCPLGNLDLQSESHHDYLENLPDRYGNRRLEEQEFMSLFEGAVNTLPEHYQRAFRLCVMGGRSYRQVAGELGIPIGTVAIRIMRARQRLYADLSHHIGRIRRRPAWVR